MDLFLYGRDVFEQDLRCRPCVRQSTVLVPESLRLVEVGGSSMHHSVVVLQIGGFEVGAAEGNQGMQEGVVLFYFSVPNPFKEGKEGGKRKKLAKQPTKTAKQDLHTRRGNGSGSPLAV